MTAPGLRKQGYKFLVTSLKRDEQDVEKIGERVSEVRGFRYYSMYEDSRNVTAQLYSTLIRRLEIEARLVRRACNLRDLCRAKHLLMVTTLFCLPLPLIWKLQLSKERKIGLSIAFTVD
jgi:hypothetical protein